MEKFTNKLKINSDEDILLSQLKEIIDSISFTNVDKKMQIEALKLGFNYIKENLAKGVPIDKIKEEMQNYVKSKGELDDKIFRYFYSENTINDVVKNPEEFKEKIAEYIRERKNYKKILNEPYTESRNENVDRLISEIFEIMVKVDSFIDNEKFNNAVKKIKENKLTLEDVDTISYYLIGSCQDSYFDSHNITIDKIRENPNYYVNILVDNIDNIYECQNSLKNDSILSNNNKNGAFNVALLQKIEAERTKTKFPSAFQENNYTKNIKSVKEKKFVKNPLYVRTGVQAKDRNKKLSNEDEKNNFFIIYHHMQKYLNDDQKFNLYDRAKRIKSKEKNPMLKKKCKDDLCRILLKLCDMSYNLNFNQVFSKRIKQIVELFYKVGFLDDFNKEVNRQNELLGVKCLNSTTEEVREELSNLQRNTSISLESKIGLLAFYTNRYTKKINYFVRPSFLLEKMNVFELLEKNPKMNFEDLEINNEELELYMKQHDALCTIMQDEYYYKLTEDERNGKTNEKTKEKYNKAVYKYRDAYNSLFHNSYEKDILNILNNVDSLQNQYKNKENAMSELLYLALQGNNDLLVNWGYVPGDRNEDFNVVLLGFDFMNLNMPLFLHIKREKLLNIVKRATGVGEIPVYKGAENISRYTWGGKNISTPILKPTTQKQRQNLEKLVNRSSLYITHIKRLQGIYRPLSTLDSVKKATYDIKTGKVNRILDEQDPTDDADNR